jgi:Tfp pilus assembly protein PilP
VKRDDEIGLLLLVVAYVVSKLENPARAAVKALEQAGAKAYEVVHPEQRAHADDLPGHALHQDAIEAIAQSVGFPNPHLASAFAMAESHGYPNALVRSSREYSVGLWQINLLAHPQYTHEQMADPYQNAAAAFLISKRGTDWEPWHTTLHSGAYRRFL